MYSCALLAFTVVLQYVQVFLASRDAVSSIGSVRNDTNSPQAMLASSLTN